MVDLYKEIDFQQELNNIPKLAEFIKKASQEIQSTQITDQIVKKPYLNTSFDQYLVLTGIPIMDIDKLKVFHEKFLMGMIFQKVGIKEFVEGADYGFKEGQKETNGSAFIRFDTPENAKISSEKLNNLKIDQKHTIKTYTVQEFENILSQTDEYVQPKCLPEYKLQSWAIKDSYREQYCYSLKNKIYVNWFDHLEGSTSNGNISGQEYIQLPEDKQFVKCEWSKNGGYLVVYFKTGFQLYGGDEFQELNFFHHLDVQNVEFSQNERYIVSFNNTVLYAPNSENYIIWNTLSGESLRKFKAEARDQWGTFKFSSNSNYIARCGENQISVYELPTMRLIQGPDQTRTPIRIPNIERFEWIPNQKVICCVSYVKDKDKEKDQIVTKGSQSNTKVTLIDIESRQEWKKWKSITYELNDCKIIPSLEGDCLCLIMQKRLAKKKTSTLVHVGTFSKNKLEIQDLEFNEKVVSYDFEKTSRRMVIAYDDTEKGQSITHFSFIMYNIDRDTNQIKEIGKLEKKFLKECLISPQGSFFALVNKDIQHQFQGSLEFYYLKPKDQKSNSFEFELLKENKMNYMTHAQWDPSGKLLITGSYSTNTIIIWNAYGKQLYKDTFNNLNDVMWRIRPNVQLTPSKEKEIIENYKNYQPKYAEFDDSIINRSKREQEARQKEQKEIFMRFMQEKRDEWEAQRQQRVELIGFDEDDRSDLTMDEIIEREQVLEKKEIEN